MAITPSSRWISKGENGSDEDSVPFEKSKKACFQIFFCLLGLCEVLPYRIFRSVSVFLFEN